MRIVVLTLADFASVREGLLNVMSGGVAFIGKQAFPAPMSCYLAALVEIEVGDDTSKISESELPVVVDIANSSGELIASANGAFGGPGSIFGDPELPTAVPIALDLQGITLPTPDIYSLTMRVGGAAGDLASALTFRAHEIPGI